MDVFGSDFPGLTKKEIKRLNKAGVKGELKEGVFSKGDRKMRKQDAK